MAKKVDVACWEKPVGEGLTKQEVMSLYDILKEGEALPLEIDNPNGTSVAIGFIAMASAENMNYDFYALKLGIESILEDMEKESDSGCYSFLGCDVFLTR